MSFFKGIMNSVHRFKDAVKAGSDFNPLLETVEKELEALHREGKLDDVLYQAEQSYVKEHGAYVAKGTHTNAFDSQTDVEALRHFLAALKQSTVVSSETQEHISNLLEMHKKMEDALGPLGKLI